MNARLHRLYLCTAVHEARCHNMLSFQDISTRVRRERFTLDSARHLYMAI